VVLATASVLPRPDEDDLPLREALAAQGLAATTRAWDDPGVDWAACAACIVRSTWNYVRHHREFLEWTERCAALTALWNPAPVIRWNSHKSYLLELAGRGLPVVPTRMLSRGNGAGAALDAVLVDWPQVVIKPAVSAGSFGTLRVTRAELSRGQAHLEALAAQGEVLVQPYFPSVETHGERALVFIDGAFTHEIRKQARFAGQPQRVSAPLPVSPQEAAVAERILAAAPGPLLYARVDLARDQRGQPCLMELELIEPSLFLSQAPAATARLAAAIARLTSC
jgi:hypothetical protein